MQSEAEEFLVPEVLASKVLYRDGCKFAVYSSNRDNFLAPFLSRMEGDFFQAGKKLTNLGEIHLLASDLSPSCDRLALVADQTASGNYDVFIYSFENKTLKNLSSSVNTDDGKPIFSQSGRFLAWLSSGQLRIENLQIPSSPTLFRNLIWSVDDKSLFLIDTEGSIWKYDLSLKLFLKLFKSKKRASLISKMLLYGNSLYFNSDFDGEFSQIYRLNINSRLVDTAVESSWDKYPELIDSEGNLVFRENVEGSYLLKVKKGEKVETLFEEPGVLYSVFSLSNKLLASFASDRLPLNLVELSNPKKGLLPSLNPRQLPESKVFVSKEGWKHPVYQSKKSTGDNGKIENWVLWLHGGPHEQVSPRYNPFFDYFSSKGLSILALNYPGSTGYGNSNELRKKTSEQQGAIQREWLETEIRRFRSEYPNASFKALVGVSAGAGLAHFLAGHLEEKPKLVDYSGLVTTKNLKNKVVQMNLGKRTIFFFGEEDYVFKNPFRKTLLRDFEKHGAKVVKFPAEGHYLRARESMKQVFESLDRVLFNSH